MEAKRWLVKQEPAEYAWGTLVREGRVAWTGVRNFQARNYLRQMRAGEAVLYYHSGEGREVVGVAEVIRVAYPDPTAREGDWSAVDLKPKMSLERAVTLDAIKGDPLLREIPLVRQSRLSVMPITESQFRRVLALAAAGGGSAEEEVRARKRRPVARRG